MRDKEVLRNATALLKKINELVKSCGQFDVSWTHGEQKGSLVVELTLSPEKGVDIHERFNKFIKLHAGSAAVSDKGE